MQNIFENVLRSEDWQVVDKLPKFVLKEFYLAGGTGLALQIGHRYSYYLDFFSNVSFNNLDLKNQLNTIGKFKLFQDHKGTLEGVVDQTRVTFLFYPYLLLEKTAAFHQINLASMMDIALMKLSSLSSRGSKKDFIDLFFLKDFLDWPMIIVRFEKKFKGSGYNIYHLIKSLTFFKDALQEPDPNMITPYNWKHVEDYFKKVQMQLADLHLK